MPIKDNTLENISFSTWIHLWTLLINVIDVIMSISKTLMVHTCSKHQQAHVWPPGLLPPWCLWLATPGGLDANTNRAAAVLPTAAAKPGFGDRVRLKPDFTISPGQALRLDCTSTVHSSIAHLVSIVLGLIIIHIIHIIRLTQAWLWGSAFHRVPTGLPLAQLPTSSTA